MALVPPRSVHPLLLRPGELHCPILLVVWWPLDRPQALHRAPASTVPRSAAVGQCAAVNRPAAGPDLPAPAVGVAVVLLLLCHRPRVAGALWMPVAADSPPWTPRRDLAPQRAGHTRRFFLPRSLPQWLLRHLRVVAAAVVAAAAASRSCTPRRRDRTPLPAGRTRRL